MSINTFFRFLGMIIGLILVFAGIVHEYDENTNLGLIIMSISFGMIVQILIHRVDAILNSKKNL
jgi:general stress protein CsbA